MEKIAKKRITLKSIVSTYGIYIVFVVIVAFLAALTEGNFVSGANIVTVLRQISINGIIAIGMTFVIITGGIDLSVGAVLALAGAIGTDFTHTDMNMPLIVPFLIAIAIGALCGAVSGVIISYVGAPPFVVTMGMMQIARGATYLYTGGAPIKDLSEAFMEVGKGDFLQIPIPVYILAIVLVIAVILLHKARFGRCLYAIGGNEEAAYASGINVKLNKTTAYVISGVCSAICGLILAARTGAAAALAGDGYELNAIAAVVIGGTSLSGGKGTIVGTLIGALIIGSISNGLDLMNVSSYVQTVVKGVIIIAAVCLDARTAAKKH